MSIPQIGCEGWKGVNENIPEYKHHILNFNEALKWDRVVKLCSSLRGGMRCEISAKFSVGCFKIVKLVEFEDGVKWVAAITMPPRDEEDDKKLEVTSAKKQLESLITTYRYLAQHTTLPVPEVFAADSESTNELGAPYMIMTYLPGIPVDSFPYKDGRYGTKEQTDYLLRQMADMFVELAQCKFKQIGSIFQDPDTREFYVGADLETGKAFETAQEYYQTLGLHRFRYYSKTYLLNNLAVQLNKGMALPLVFNNLISIFASPENDNGEFRLTNRDFGFHNILVDETFTIRGIIDCDSIKAAPIDVVAQYPLMSEMERRPPGYKTTWPPRLRTYGFGEAQASEFRQYVREAEQRLCTSKRNETPLADAMESDGARFVEGIDKYCTWQARCHEDWIRAYWYMYYRRIRGPKAALEYDEPPPPDDSDSDSESGSESDNESQSNKDSEGSQGKNAEEDLEGKGSPKIVHGDGEDEVCNVPPGVHPVSEEAKDLPQPRTLVEITDDSTASMESPILGSDGWFISDHLPENWHQQIQKCDKTTNWQAVASLCSSLRNGMQCTISQKLKGGTRKLVKLVEFEDGVKWVACITMEPKVDSKILTSYPPQYTELAMKTEMAAYNYLREKTSIPVPAVFAADPEANNDVGRPYMIMSYVDGSLPYHVEQVDGLAVTELQYKHLLQQMAKIAAELAQCKFDRIGSLFQDDETKEYYIGIDPEIGAGPFDTPVEYYNAVSRSRFNYHTAHIENNLATEQNKGFELPFIFNNLMPVLSEYETATGPFSLTNMDFGFHNILIDMNFNIVGVIDCDSIMSAPIESVAQYPYYGETERVPLGMTTDRSSVRRTWDGYASARRLYHDMLAEAESSYPRKGESPTPIADAIDSDGAFLVAGLTEYTLRDNKSRQEWLKSYWYMYYRHVKGENHALMFREVVPEDYNSNNNANDNESVYGDSGSDSKGSKRPDDQGSAAPKPTAVDTCTPRHKLGDDENAPAIVGTHVVEAFREFANKEKLRVEQNRQDKKSQNKADVLNDLMSFSKNFKLRTPVDHLDSPEADDSLEIITCDTQDVNRQQLQAEIADNQDEGGQSIDRNPETKPFDLLDSPEEDDSVNIITCDTQDINRQQWQVETAENQREEGNINDFSSDDEDEGNCAGIKITVTDVERFEGLKRNPGPGEVIDDDGVPTDDSAVEDATLKVEALTPDGGKSRRGGNQNINNQDNDCETGTPNTTADVGL